MFSLRTPNDFSPNALSRRMQEKLRSGARLLDLTESNPTRAGFLAPQELLVRLADPDAARYAPDPLGLVSAREAVSRDFAARGALVPSDRIVLTASSSESYSLLFKLLANSGDEILVPAPSYPLFGHLAHLDLVRARPYPLRFDSEWHVSVDAIKDMVGPTTRAVVVVHPNNPTGSFLKREEAEAILALCAERGLALIADEVFADFAISGGESRRHSTFASDSPALAFTLGGLSKSCGLPQLKVGWIALSGPAPLKDEALARLEFAADTYLSVATPVQLALPWILERKDALQSPIKGRLGRNLEALGRAVAAHPELTLLPVQGGWSAIIQCPATLGDEDRALLALDADVLVHPGHFFDFESGCYLVVSLLCETEIFDLALPRLMDAAVR